MSAHRVTLIPGDGIGPEISEATKRVVDASGATIDWEIQEAGAHLMQTEKTPLPERVIDSIKENKVALKGPITTPVGSGFRSINVELRKRLDLYVNLRPALSLPGNGSRYSDIDIVVVRENTEDLYAGIEFEEGQANTLELIKTIDALSGANIAQDSGISIKPISRQGSERIVRWAFEYAKTRGRKKVTSVHKANIMKYTDGLYLDISRKVAQEYEGIVEFNDKIVDACSMGLVLHPEDFDVLVLPNLYGDIVSDICAGLVGGLGLAPGANLGDEYALFEPVHGSAPKHAGQNTANPSAQMLSAVMMLEHLGEDEAAQRLFNAIKTVLSKGEKVTYDIKRTLTGSTAGSVSTSEYADAVIAAMK